MQLYNKILERVKITKFFFSSKDDKEISKEENAPMFSYKESMVQSMAQASEMYD